MMKLEKKGRGIRGLGFAQIIRPHGRPHARHGPLYGPQQGPQQSPLSSFNQKWAPLRPRFTLYGYIFGEKPPNSREELFLPGT